jgi:RimJ/RimL family protein N-acetyltransferase
MPDAPCGSTACHHHRVEVPELRTERLLMRDWRETDLEPFAQLNADPEVMEFLQGPRVRRRSDETVCSIRRTWDERGFGLWAVEVIGQHDFIGYIGLSPAEFEAPFTPSVEVGYRLARSAWGQGYATEGARAAVRWGFQVAHLPEILSFTPKINERSRAVMERIGMRRDLSGDFQHPWVPEGNPIRPHVLYRLTGQSRSSYTSSPPASSTRSG